MVHSQQERVPKPSFTYHIGGRWRAITMSDASVQILPRRHDKILTTSNSETGMGHVELI